MTSPSRGRFIVFEGGEGAGKSTLMTLMARRLQAAGVRTVEAREPGGTPAGEWARELLTQPLTPWGEAFAFLLARAELVSGVIRPALNEGATVLCDRFSASTIAYQGHGRGLDRERLAEMNAAATQGLEPDLTIYLDVPLKVGLDRKYTTNQPSLGLPGIPEEDIVPSTGGETSGPAVGREGRTFHERVREGYRRQWEEAPAGSWLKIDASRPAEAVEAEAWAAVAALLGLEPPASA